MACVIETFPCVTVDPRSPNGDFLRGESGCNEEGEYVSEAAVVIFVAFSLAASVAPAEAASSPSEALLRSPCKRHQPGPSRKHLMDKSLVDQSTGSSGIALTSGLETRGSYQCGS